MSDLETILALQAAETANDNSGLATLLTGGGVAAGALGGALSGDVLEEGKALRRRIADMVDPIMVEKDGKQVRQARGSSLGARLKPGHRMAGGLVGAILGGALGNVAAQQALTNPAAQLLAKAQTGNLRPADEKNLELMIADYYVQQGLI